MSSTTGGDKAARRRQALIQLTRPGPGDLETRMRDATRLTAETLEIDRVGVWLFPDDDRGFLRLRMLYERGAERHTSGVQLKAADHPAYLEALAGSDLVTTADARTDPRTRSLLESYLAPLGITSMMDVPIYVEGSLRGVLCHERVGPARPWTADEEAFAVAVAGVVALAIGQEERLEAERELSASELRYRLVSRATGDVIWDWDLETNRVSWNESLSTELGHEPSDVGPDARWWLENIHPEDRERVSRCIHAVIDAGGGEWSDDYRFLRGDGMYAHVYDRGTVIRDDSGKAVRMIGAMLDLTARKQAETALRETQERFRELAENIQGVFWLRDLKSGRVVYVSPAFDVIWGRPRQALLDRPELWGECVHLDDLDRALAKGVDVKEYRIVRPDGMIRWIRERTFPVRNERGETYRIAGVAEDVTDRKEAEEILRFQKSLLEAQTEAAQDGVLVVSNDGRVLSHNRRLSQLWEIPEGGVSSGAELTAMSFILSKLVRPKEFLARVRFLHDNPDDVSSEEILLSDGRVFDHYSAPVRAPGKGFYGRVWFFRDVTARKKLEAQLRQSQKMEGIGRLAGGVAHDFNNLLTAILGYSDVLATKLKGQDSLLADLAEIKSAGERAASLTSQLLAFSRMQPVMPKVLDLNNVVVKIEKMLRRLIGEDVELKTELSAHLGCVRADAGQLDQVLMNLAVNARDAMPKGGQLTISTRDVEVAEAFVRENPGAKAGPHVLLRVADTGVGMPKEVLSHVFEPFFTTKEQGKGTGLGLATVYGIVKQNGGYVGVRSALGRGTSFEIYLPRVAEKATRGDETQFLPTISGLASGRVLLVEDEAVVRGLVRQTLKTHGYTVVEATNGDEALRMIGSDTARFDLLVTDLIMPKMGGRDLALKLKERWPDLPVLYMSGYTDDAAFREGGVEPDSALISKPFSPNQIVLKVRKTLQQAARLSNSRIPAQSKN